MKTSNRIRVAVCLAILFTLLTRPSLAKACSCVADVTISNNFSWHDAIFTGKVIRIVDNYFPYFSTADYILYKLGYPNYFFSRFARNAEKRLGFSVFFKVLKSWKGVEKTFVEVNTGRGGGDCGYSFVSGQEYLIYASHAYGKPGNYWVTGICSRNAILHDATEDLTYLNSFPELTQDFAISILWTENDSITFMLATIILGIVVFVKQRRNRGQTSI